MVMINDFTEKILHFCRENNFTEKQFINICYNFEWKLRSCCCKTIIKMELLMPQKVKTILFFLTISYKSAIEEYLHTCGSLLFL
jgi:hypothetical protein